MSDIRNELSWSKSRYEMFQTCPRQYYFNYYGYWGGWEKGAPERTRQIYILKNLKNRHMWAGNVVHDCIKHSLKNLQRGIKVLDVEEIITITINKMRDEFRSSRDRRYLTHPKTCALFEHEYEENVPGSEWKQVADHVEQCLRNFYSSELFPILKSIHMHDWLEVEDFSFFYLDNTKIWAVIDCSYKTNDGVTIIDWKTGRGITEDLSLQLSCYAMYGMDKWKVSPENIKIIEYNLLSNQNVEFSIIKGEILNTRAQIQGSIADMKSMLVDIEKNIPKDESFFMKISDERIRERCNFKKICQ